MPLMLQVECARCGVKTSYSQGMLVALDARGNKTTLPHPLEALYAERLGASLSELRAKGRLRRERPFLCRACGNVQYDSAIPLRCDQCAGSAFVRVGGSPETPGGCAVFGLAVAFALLPALTGALLYCLPGIMALVALLLAGHVRAVRYRRALARTACWACGHQTLRETVSGVS
jgi:hypothetical protein